VGEIVIDFDDKTGVAQRRQRVVEEIELKWTPLSGPQALGFKV
jgi:hypothetical protein